MFTQRDCYIKQEYHRENLRNAEHRRLVREGTSAEREILRYLCTTARDLAKLVFTRVRRAAQETEDATEGAAPLVTVKRQR